MTSVVPSQHSTREASNLGFSLVCWTHGSELMPSRATNNSLKFCLESPSIRVMGLKSRIQKISRALVSQSLIPGLYCVKSKPYTVNPLNPTLRDGILT